jgi:formylglycine-generating enzyme required for sulfatase activity
MPPTMTGPKPSPQPVQQLGRYQLLSRINAGGMAEVFFARETGLEGFERIVAIKRILPDLVQDKQFIKMFVDEAKLVAQLEHANIAHIFEFNRVDDAYFIALEYLSGRDLRAIFERCREQPERGRTTMPVAQACFIIMNVCEGLDYAHSKTDGAGRPLGLVHRDVSPQNVIVTYDGQVKIIDFGIAKAASQSSKTQTGILKGKFGYLSPEQSRGLPLDRRSDIFSVGIILYELLAGERLFLGDTDFSTLEKVRKCEVPSLRRYNREIPWQLEQIVLKALAREREERYQSAIELHDDLRAHLQSAGLSWSRKELSGWMQRTFTEEMRAEARLREQVTAAAAAPRAQASAAARPTPAPAAAAAVATDPTVAEYVSHDRERSARSPLRASRTGSASIVKFILLIGALGGGVALSLRAVDRLRASRAGAPEAIDRPAPPVAAEPAVAAPAPDLATTGSPVVTPLADNRVAAGASPDAAVGAPVAAAPAEVRAAATDMATVAAAPVAAAPVAAPAAAAGQPASAPAGMVHVPATGEAGFWMGSQAVDSHASPRHHVQLSAFFIDQTEVTQAQYKACVDAHVCRTPSGDWRPAARPSHPVAGVSWDDAVAYCGFAGGQLPTEAQWEYAARGTDERVYPWGNEKPSCARTNFNSCAGGTRPVMSYRHDERPELGDRSFFGIFDMGGNVAEWVSDVYDSSYYKTAPEKDPPGPEKAGSSHVVRGGSWQDAAPYLRAALRGKSLQSNRLPDIGFRCARAAP